MKNPTLSSTRSRGAFTLIELLTVIAIIGILAAILIPVVSAVRDSARASNCVSNMRQIGNAVHLFALDTNDHTPPNVAPGNPPTIEFQVGNYIADRTYGFLLSEERGGVPAGNANRRAAGIGNVNYLDDADLLICPGLKDEVFANPGFKPRGVYSAAEQITRMGYIWMYYVPDYGPSSGPNEYRLNHKITEDPRNPLLWDFGWEASAVGWWPDHYKVASHNAINVLHIGGQVTQIPVDAVNGRTGLGLHEFYDYIAYGTERTSGGGRRPR